MRKFQREIKNFEEIVTIIDKCDTVHLGLYADDYPYIVPLSFGYESENGKITIYFHCATEGKKINLIGKDSRVCAEFEVFNGYVDTGHSLTADYESVIGFGNVEICNGDEKIKGIKLLLKHTKHPEYSAEGCAAMPIVAVYKIVLTHFTAKKRFA